MGKIQMGFLIRKGVKIGVLNEKRCKRLINNVIMKKYNYNENNLIIKILIFFYQKSAIGLYFLLR